MEHAPPRSQGHLVVAAVRILAHKSGRPPSIEELADILGWSKELVGHLVRALESRAIVHTIKSPFDLRVEVGNHLGLEELPVEDTGPGLQDEVEEFHQRFRKKQEELQNLFDSGDVEERKKQRLAGLDRELEGFKTRRANPFGDAPAPEQRPDPFGGEPEERR
jgi:DNA-binding transcriptional regulator GbsR (MarR family)